MFKSFGNDHIKTNPTFFPIPSEKYTISVSPVVLLNNIEQLQIPIPSALYIFFFVSNKPNLKCKETHSMICKIDRPFID